MRQFLAILAVCLFSSVGLGENRIPAEIYTDPVQDKKFPATMIVLHIPSQGVAINGVAYLPPGAGPHPILVICHGLPGNEKNLDLAQAVRRAGWTAITFNYRGSWGSPGTFSFEGSLVDTEAVLAYLKDPKTVSSLHLDPHRIVIAGHSMGGAMTALAASRDHTLAGAVMISAWDMASAASDPQLVADMADDMETLAGVTADSMVSDLRAHASEFSFSAAANALVDTPLLVLTSDDGGAEGSDALVRAIRAKGGRHVTTMHAATDHGWSDRRIELQSDVITWLKQLH